MLGSWTRPRLLGTAPGRSALRATGAALALTTVLGVGLAAASSGPSAPVPAPDQAATAVLAAARTHLGDRYVYGGSGPTTWDCSGLTSTMWRQYGGVSGIPRTAAQQQAWATPVPADQALPGDLVFFGRPATHVALYEGDGWIIDASDSRQQVVERTLWTTDVGYGRVPRATAPVVTPGPTDPGQPTTPPTTGSTPPPAAGGDAYARAFLRIVQSRVGARYAIGGSGPAYDDGALLAGAWRQATGVSVPSDRTALAKATTPVSAADLQPGDVLIYGARTAVWHVAVYLGDGAMIDASRSHGDVAVRPVLASAALSYGRLPRPVLHWHAVHQTRGTGHHPHRGFRLH